MTYILNTRERKALDRLHLLDQEFVVKGKMATGVGYETLASLVKLGLAEVGISVRHHGVEGWRITDDGWRCMYGKTKEELMSGGGPHHPLRVWSWPPSDR